MALEVAIHLLEALVSDLDSRPVLLEKLAPEPAADEEARGVAQDRAGPHEPDQGDQLDLALPGDHASGDHDGLPRCHQPHERAGLQESSTRSGERL